MEPERIRLFFTPKERLRMTYGEEQSWPTVKPAWASPLTHPKRYLALMNGKNEEIVMIVDPSSLNEESTAALKEELTRRYLTAEVTAITHAKAEFGATYWHVDTDRGSREFVTQSLQENVQWLSDKHVLLIDVDGNRFEISDVESLDAKSRAYIEHIL